MKKIYIVVALMMSIGISARFRQVFRPEKLQDYLQEYEYAVVCFASSDNSDFITLKRQVESAAKSHEFKTYLAKEVGFLLVDIDAKRNQGIEQDYPVTKVPVCVLFKNGSIIFDKQSPAQIFEPVTKARILQFVEKYLEQDLGDIIDEKKEQEELNQRERIARYETYVRWGSPYGFYGYGPGWGWYGYRGYPYRYYWW